MYNSDGIMRTVSWFSEHRAAAASTLATTASLLEDMGGSGGGGAHVPVPGYVSVRPIEWALGRVPLDRLHVRVYHKSVELGATIAVCAAAVLCIILTLALLVFNVYYRKRKCVHHISVHCTEHLPNHPMSIIMKSTLRCQYSTYVLCAVSPAKTNQTVESEAEQHGARGLSARVRRYHRSGRERPHAQANARLRAAQSEGGSHELTDTTRLPLRSQYDMSGELSALHT